MEGQARSVRTGRLNAGFRAVAKLVRLQRLVLWNCMQLSNPGLSFLTNLSSLAELSLRGCQQLTDAITPTLAHLSNLTTLDLRACERFTGCAAPSFAPQPLPYRRNSDICKIRAAVSCRTGANVSSVCMCAR